MAEVKAVSRVEAIQSGDDVKPVSREEYFLKKSIGQGGSGGAGYTVETKAVEVVPEQSVTTVKKEGQLFASAQINLAEGITYNDIPDTLTITFQGQKYVCSNNSSDSNIKSYGAPIDNSTGEVDFSQYSFALGFTQDSNVLVTESTGTYTVKATDEQKTVTPSQEFKEAANSSVKLKLVVELSDKSLSTFEKIRSAMENGIAVYGSRKVTGPTSSQTLAPCIMCVEVIRGLSYACFLTTDGTNVTVEKVTYL